MSRVQDIKDAVGKDDFPRALVRAPGGSGFGRADLRGGVQSGCVALGLKLKVWLNNGSDTCSL
jgi:hypothetical protein